ncbi:MAG: DUF4296 domain-containing protein [Bacteroidia bacterium]|nr:DUF4296 domain-containing protein [Bacteroidia bacterium]
MIRLVAFFLFMAMISCGKPDPPIPQKDFIKVMLDVHLAEAIINNHHPIKLRDSLYSVYMKEVLDKHSLSKEEFEMAMDHMLSDPDYLELIYNELSVEITTWQDALDDNITQGETQSKGKPKFK